MKKLIVISTVLALVLSVFTYNPIPPLSQLNEDDLPSLSGKTAVELSEKWGGRDGMLSGMYGDIWHIDDENMVVVYYDGMENSKVLDAHIAEIQRDNTRVFVYRDSKEEIIKPGFVLQDDGVFTMTFSAVSSFFAVGKYEETENDLTFYTNEGDLWYHFIKTDKGYVYDTAKSTGSTWFADIPDGALFY